MLCVFKLAREKRESVCSYKISNYGFIKLLIRDHNLQIILVHGTGRFLNNCSSERPHTLQA